MNLKLKALIYTVGILVGLSIVISISIFLILTYVTQLMLTFLMVSAAVGMAGLLIYDVVKDSLSDTLGRKNKGE